MTETMKRGFPGMTVRGRGQLASAAFHDLLLLVSSSLNNHALEDLPVTELEITHGGLFSTQHWSRHPLDPGAVGAAAVLLPSCADPFRSLVCCASLHSP
jgi:hypothetical protein